jgi:enterochelin esterase-like enzyme
VGDVLLRINGTDIQGDGDMFGVSRTLHAGDRVTLTVSRNGHELTLPVPDGVPPAAAPAAFYTLQFPGPHSSTPCLPSTPYTVLPVPISAAGLPALQPGETSVAIQGDVLSIVHRVPGGGLQIGGGTFQLPMGQVPGTDLWTLQMQMAGWDKAFFSYIFFSPSVMGGKSSVFRGSSAPAAPAETAHLASKIIRTTLHSEQMGEDHGVEVYLPPGSTTGPLPALFMADGESIETFASVVEPLIQAGKVRPFAIIGSDAGTDPPPSADAPPRADRRMREYLRVADPEFFEHHMQFFTEELLSWAVRTYGVSEKPADRAVFGYSNGAAFVLSLTQEHPQLFGAALPFSVATWAGHLAGPMPRFFLAAGELEPAFSARTQGVYQQLRDAGASAVFKSYMSGHDSAMWTLALVNYMPDVFPPK